MSSLRAPHTQRLGDRVFSGTTRAAALVILLAMAGVAVFLAVEGIPALGAGAEALGGAGSFTSYLWPLIYGAVLAAVIALLIATRCRWAPRW